jgi:hypothetical protein
MNSVLHFLHIYRLDFHLKKTSCLQTLRRFHGVISFSRYPFVEIIFYENQDGICFLWDLGFWILTIQPSHSFTLANCRPIYPPNLYWISKHWKQPWLPTKKTFSSSSIVIILQSMWSLWLKFFLQTINIVRYKILQLEVEKHHFILIIGPDVNKYIF